VKLRRHQAPPEDSVRLRVVVALAVEISIVAVVTQGALGAPTAIAALVLAPIGYLFSYRQRNKPAMVVKILITAGLLIAVAHFFDGVRAATTVDEARAPLATLFIWVQVLHSFDVPRRRDLAFSMVSSLILMAEAGSLSLSTSFVFLLLPWFVLASFWLLLSSRPPAWKLTPVVSAKKIVPRGRSELPAQIRMGLRAAGAALLATTLVFMAMPRLPGSIVHAPPFSLVHAAPVSNFDGEVSNPALASNPGSTVDFAPDAYPGFSNIVDLQSRGHLSDQIAFRVRAPQAALWRAETFDTYDDSRWTESDQNTQSLVPGWDGTAWQIPPEIARMNGSLTDINRMVQTFYIDTPQPNVLFAAPGVSQVYFPSGGLRVDNGMSIRSPILLDKGLIYSVISDVPLFQPDVLRQDAGTRVPAGMQNYLQVPSSIPPRVGELASQITAGDTTEFDRVQAIQSWLRTNTKYNLDVPRQPPGVDGVDYFLFVTRQGFCEHIASAMAILLRTLGIPTRLVTGYGPGTRNLLTGYFEVKESDAHAWVEVYYPRIGWVSYDPTFGVPEAAPSPLSRFMAGPLLAAMGHLLRAAVPPAVARALGRVGGAVAGSVRGWKLVVVVASLVLIGLALAVALRRRRRSGPKLSGLDAALAELSDALAPAGHVRRDSQTPREFLEAVVADRSLGDDVASAARTVVATFEAGRFSPRKPNEAEVMRARAAAAHARELVGRR
jgi:protein-glutamine gamma-glutamyltransferase